MINKLKPKFSKNVLSHIQGNGLKAQLIKGAGGTAILKVVNMILTLVIGVLMARSLGPENYGIYAFVLSLITLIALPTHAGLPTLIVRETAKNQLNKNWDLLKGLLKLSSGFVWSYSILTVIIVAVVLWFWKEPESIKTHTFLWALLLLPLIAFEGIRTSTLRGLRWVVSSQIPEQIIRPFITVSILGSILLLGNTIDAVVAMQINVFSVFIAFLIGLLLLAKALPKEISQVKAEYTITPWLVSLLPLSLFSGLNLLDSQVSILLLGFLATNEDVGLFRVAATGAALVSFGLSAVNMALAPQVARLYAAGEIEKLQQVITLSTRVVAVISFPVALIFIFAGENIITLIFGIQYAQAATALAILSVGQLVNASMGSVALVLNMTGHDSKTLVGVIVALVSNISCGLVLIPFYGLIGAAIGYTVSLIIWNILLYYQTRKATGINTFLI